MFEIKIVQSDSIFAGFRVPERYHRRTDHLLFNKNNLNSNGRSVVTGLKSPFNTPTESKMLYRGKCHGLSNTHFYFRCETFRERRYKIRSVFVWRIGSQTRNKKKKR